MNPPRLESRRPLATDAPLRSSLAALWLIAPLHGTAPSSVPHWAVLLVVVLGLWFFIGTTVVAVDRLLRRFGA